MKIMPKYLFNNLLMPLLYLLLAFTLLFTVADLMDNGSKFLNAGTSPLSMAYYYTLRLPSMVIMIVPICLLLAVLYSLSSLTRHNEITAMRASGISIYRILRPYLLMSFLCFLFTAVVNEYTGPKFAYRADQFVEQQKHTNNNAYFEQIAFKNPTAGHIWYIERFDTRSFTMMDLKLVQQRADNTDRIMYNAAKARWMDGRWWFEDGTIQAYDEQGNLDGLTERFDTLEMRDLPEIPEDFMGEIKDPDYQSSRELWKYIKTHQFLSPELLTKYEVDFHHKITQPFICIIIAMIGIPVGAHTGRKGAFSGIMLALVMFFSFYGVQIVMEYLAKQMYVAAWLGPWSSIMLFFVIGNIMIYRMR
jgi:lipopolysaccharide export system permease protein